MFSASARRPRLISPARLPALLQRPVGRALADHANLIVKYVSASTLDINVDEIVLTNDDEREALFADVDLTANITTSGLGGLDTGSEANSTWYWIWVVGLPNGSVSCLLSTASDRTSLTLPSSNYYSGLVGVVYNNSSGNFRQFLQKGRHVVQAEAVVASGAAYGTLTGVSYAAAIPPNVSKLDCVHLNLTPSDSNTNGTDFTVALDSNGNLKFDQHAVTAQTQKVHSTVELGPLKSTTIYFLTESGGSLTHGAFGWRYR